MGERATYAARIAEIRSRPEAAGKRITEAAHAFRRLTDPTPTDFQNYWGDKLAAFSTVLGFDVSAPPIDRSHKEIQRLREKGRTLIPRPEGLTLEHLRLVYPDIKNSWTTEPGVVIDSDHRYGWLDVEDKRMPPNRGKTKDELVERTTKDGRHGMTLETFILASFDHRDRTGDLFDFAGYESRLLGSNIGNVGLIAGFSWSGRLEVMIDTNPSQSARKIGGRFERVKVG